VAQALELGNKPDLKLAAKADYPLYRFPRDWVFAPKLRVGNILIVIVDLNNEGVHPQFSQGRNFLKNLLLFIVLLFLSKYFSLILLQMEQFSQLDFLISFIDIPQESKNTLNPPIILRLRASIPEDI
jgi:hypothetical protein